MDDGITLPPDDDDFMLTFHKNYRRIKDPNGKLKFYTGAMEEMKRRGWKAKDFKTEFDRMEGMANATLKDKLTLPGAAKASYPSADRNKLPKPPTPMIGVRG